MLEKPSSRANGAAFEKVTFENDASLLFKHVTARRFRFVYHYHPEIELMYFAEGDGLDFIGDSSQAFKAGHLVLLGSNLPHLWINDAECQYAEACVVQFKTEVLGEFLLLLPELARIRLLMESAARGVVFWKLITLEAVPLLTRLGGETGAKRLLTLLEIQAKVRAIWQDAVDMALQAWIGAKSKRHQGPQGEVIESIRNKDKYMESLRTQVQWLSGSENP